MKFCGVLLLYLNFILLQTVDRYLYIIMASPGQKWGHCGHLITDFDKHTYSARCRDKEDTEPCIKNEDCQHCNVLTEAQKSCLATPSYQEKKEKREQKAISEELSSTLMDAALVSVLGVAKDRQDLNSEELSSTPVSNPRITRVQGRYS